MYIPAHFAENDQATLHALLRAQPLATWVTSIDGELVVNHLPFLLADESDPSAANGQSGVLCAHVARANPVWRALAERPTSSVAIFQGAHAYISPSWYPGKQENGKAVPTWNYAVVHAHGVPRIIEDRDWLLRHVGQLSDIHEAAQAGPWRVADAPPEYIEQLLRAIVGIEMPIARLDGKWKISQNRPAADQHGVVAGLQARGDEAARQMATLVASRITRT